MLDHILSVALSFERKHGVPPDVVYLNPFHYDGLRKFHRAVFEDGQVLKLGFRLVIVPSNVLSHPVAALLKTTASGQRVVPFAGNDADDLNIAI